MISLLTLFDDVAAALDDVAIMTKVAIKETSMLMTDDLAVNSNVVHGVDAHQELPVVWKIFLGSLLNKVYCIIGVLALMATVPVVLKVILVLGGIYLSYEGMHKVADKLFKKDIKETKKQISVKERIKGAVRTDLILSIEIIVIAKSSLTGPMMTQVFTLINVGILASVIIYGLVAILIKVDDFGLFLVKKNFKSFGMLLVNSMPVMMKVLGFVGTVAMFLVGGGIINHTFHIPMYMIEVIQNFICGAIVGFLALMMINIFLKLKKARS